MANKQFKAESKRLLDLMINSIYTHKEIFLRELISNASDALDKLYYHSLSDGVSGISREDMTISIAVDKDTRTITVADNGVGMSKEELEQNLGTIAKSGSLAFKKDTADAADVDIIGQFGVGFYAAFMVADCVTVTSRRYDSDEAFVWRSKGADGYTITAGEKDAHGTEIELHIKPNTDEENYDEFLSSYRLQALVKKYSDYIRYPIRMAVERSRPKADNAEEYETVTEVETLNSMVPLWKKQKSEITAEDYANFYKEKFMDFDDPAKVIHSATEGAATYNALLFIPKRAPFNYYSRDYEKGLQLYASGVLIMDKCADLLPDYFSFVKGLVDSQDLSLNISREMLQHDRQLKVIAGRLEKKIHSELLSMLNNDREAYEAFFEAFGLQLKFGLYDNYGMHKDVLQDLVMFPSSVEQKPVTLAEYVSRMKEDQKYIYYACGETVQKAAALPQNEAVLDKGYEILYLTADVDEFALKMLHAFEDKEFRSVSSDDLGFEVAADEETAPTEEQTALFDAMAAALGDKVTAVKASSRLKTHPVCLTSVGELSLEMEKVLNAMPNDQKVQAQRVLEINENHPIYTKLLAIREDDDLLGQYANLLYAQAMLIEGMGVEDPVAFASSLCDLLAK